MVGEGDISTHPNMEKSPIKWPSYQKERPDFIRAIKCKRPKMKDHRGRTWDHSEKFIVNEKEISGFLDTTWGEYIYFIHDNQWYKVSLDCVRHNIPVLIPKNKNVDKNS